MEEFDLDRYLRASKRVDLSGVAWNQVSRHPLTESEARCLAYMMDIETHTTVFLRDLLATRAVSEPDVTAFLSCWAYEELWHGEAFSRFLGEAFMREFVAIHMTWGAANELATLTAYHRLIAKTNHPVLVDLLNAIIKDERRHFAFYRSQARLRLARSARARRATRWDMEHLWSIVGTGVRPQEETDFVVVHLFGDEEGHAAVREMDDTVGTLPGMHGIGIFSQHRLAALARSDRIAKRAPGMWRRGSPLPAALADV